MSDERPILIAGGGPVGMVTAACLAVEGLPVVVLEADGELSRELRGSTFSDNRTPTRRCQGSAYLRRNRLDCPNNQSQFRRF